MSSSFYSLILLVFHPSIIDNTVRSLLGKKRLPLRTGLEERIASRPDEQQHPHFEEA